MAEDLSQPKNMPAEMVRLVRFIERLKYGEIRVIVQQGKPIRIEIAVKQIRLDQPVESASQPQSGLDVVEL